MTVLLAFDKFKGAFTAAEACRAASDGVREAFPNAVTLECPIADGGEGTAEALASALGGRWHTIEVEDPLGRPVTARFATVTTEAGQRVAVLEMSQASGLVLVDPADRDPWRASTFGTGQMMLAAAEAGVDQLLVGIGGSATNDGGSGLARALGARFLDENGAEIVKLPEYSGKVKEIDLSHLRQLPEVVVACDVENPLLGDRGATRVYGPQKGIVGADEVARHEARLGAFADAVERAVGRRLREVPGAGAAGGLGFGLMAFAGGRLASGFERVADLTRLFDRVRQADLVLTGEGSLDAQTVEGKGPAGVARLARRAGIPVWAFAGRVDRSPEARRALASEFDACVEICPSGWTVEQSVAAGPALLRSAVAGNDRLREVLSRV